MWLGQASNCGSTKGPAEVLSIMVPFYLWFKFYFPLFETHHRRFPHPEIQENTIWTKIMSITTDPLTRITVESQKGVPSRKMKQLDEDHAPNVFF